MEQTAEHPVVPFTDVSLRGFSLLSLGAPKNDPRNTRTNTNGHVICLFDALQVMEGFVHVVSSISWIVFWFLCDDLWRERVAYADSQVRKGACPPLFKDLSVKQWKITKWRMMNGKLSFHIFHLRAGAGPPSSPRIGGAVLAVRRLLLFAVCW